MSGSGRQRDPSAVAMRYDGSGAPSVTARGRGEVARRIIRLAQEHGIPIRDDPALVEALGHVPLGEEIPQALYVAVAEVLAFVYHLNDERPETAEDPA